MNKKVFLLALLTSGEALHGAMERSEECQRVISLLQEKFMRRDNSYIGRLAIKERQWLSYPIECEEDARNAALFVREIRRVCKRLSPLGGYLEKFYNNRNLSEDFGEKEISFTQKIIRSVQDTQSIEVSCPARNTTYGGLWGTLCQNAPGSRILFAGRALLGAFELNHVLEQGPTILMCVPERG